MENLCMSVEQLRNVSEHILYVSKIAHLANLVHINYTIIDMCSINIIIIKVGIWTLHINVKKEWFKYNYGINIVWDYD